MQLDEPVDNVNVPAAQAVQTIALPMENVLIGQYAHDTPDLYVPGEGHVVSHTALHPGAVALPLAHERHPDASPFLA